MPCQSTTGRIAKNRSPSISGLYEPLVVMRRKRAGSSLMSFTSFPVRTKIGSSHCGINNYRQARSVPAATADASGEGLVRTSRSTFIMLASLRGHSAFCNSARIKPVRDRLRRSRRTLRQFLTWCRMTTSTPHGGAASSLLYSTIVPSQT